MIEKGTFHESKGHYSLRFERSFSQKAEEVFAVLTDPGSFTQWYPFATGEMDVRHGGEIAFDDGEGTTYKGTITEFEEPFLFAFHEGGADLIRISLQEKNNGCRMTFIHTFEDPSWAVQTAAGWHRCLDAFGQIVNGEQIKWDDNAGELREMYREAFKVER
ncbi:SRPBCC family protein [Cytobacillus gottheilii]|uniref:SRPBCC family protein n=1 Tax=Cytobacillus gottheilii TaxID=859144 RepID=UPI0009BAE22C|nr:SRPBCC family protein [Cytobacillus gottheilii]